MGLKFNREKCIGCKLCHLACSAAHEGTFVPTLARLNIDSYYEEDKLIINGNVCALCGECVDYCPASAIAMKDENLSYDAYTKSNDVFFHRFSEKTQLSYDEEMCINCGLCIEVCPENVIIQKKDSVGLCDQCDGSPMCVKYCPHGALVYEEEI